MATNVEEEEEEKGNEEELTSIDPLNLALKAKSTRARICWWSITVIDFLVLIYFMTALILKYETGQINAKVHLKKHQDLFPAVTFCNMNPYKRSALEKISKTEILLNDYKREAGSSRNDDSDDSSKKRKKRKATIDECNCTSNVIAEATRCEPTNVNHTYKLIIDFNATNRCAWKCCARYAPSGLYSCRLAKIDNKPLIDFLRKNNIITRATARIGLFYSASGHFYDWYNSPFAITGNSIKKRGIEMFGGTDSCIVNTGDQYNYSGLVTVHLYNASTVQYGHLGHKLEARTICEYFQPPNPKIYCDSPTVTSRVSAASTTGVSSSATQAQTKTSKTLAAESTAAIKTKETTDAKTISSQKAPTKFTTVETDPLSTNAAITETMQKTTASSTETSVAVGSVSLGKDDAASAFLSTIMTSSHSSQEDQETSTYEAADAISPEKIATKYTTQVTTPLLTTRATPEATLINGTAATEPTSLANDAATTVSSTVISTSAKVLTSPQENQEIAATQEDESKEQDKPTAQSSISALIQKMLDKVKDDSNALSATKQDVLVYLLAALPPSVLIEAGYNATEVIMRCVYNGIACSISDFELKLDPNYGNCYTFNANGAFAVGARAGANTGLSVTYNVGVNHYLDFSQTVGVRVVVHKQNETVFPDVMGFNVPSRYQSATAMTRTETKSLGRASKPCANSIKDVFTYNYNDAVYSNEACLRSCYQKEVIAKCQCGDPRVPLPKRVKFCGLGKRDCVNDNYDVNLNSSCYCPPACRLVDYETTQTSSRWPSFYGRNIERSNFYGAFTSNDKSQLARIDVYYKQLAITEYVEARLYTWDQLMWDLSSLIGLALGISFISLFEVIKLEEWCRKKRRWQT